MLVMWRACDVLVMWRACDVLVTCCVLLMQGVYDAGGGGCELLRSSWTVLIRRVVEFVDFSLIQGRGKNKLFSLPSIHYTTYQYHLKKHTTTTNSLRKKHAIMNQQIGSQVLKEMSEPRKDAYRIIVNPKSHRGLERRQLMATAQEIYKHAVQNRHYTASLSSFRKLIDRHIYKRYVFTSQLTCQACLNQTFLANTLGVDNNETFLEDLQDFVKELSMENIGLFPALLLKEQESGIIGVLVLVDK